MMERIKKRNPLAGTADVLRSVAAGWKQLSAKERRPYEKLVADDKAWMICTFVQIVEYFTSQCEVANHLL